MHLNLGIWPDLLSTNHGNNTKYIMKATWLFNEVSVPATFRS